jgi:hypothetical protein
MCTSLRFWKIGCAISILQMITRASWSRSIEVHILILSNMGRFGQYDSNAWKKFFKSILLQAKVPRKLLLKQ